MDSVSIDIRSANQRLTSSRPFIDNPLYKGAWAPRKIDNPNYFEDKTPADFEPMGAVSWNTKP